MTKRITEKNLQELLKEAENIKSGDRVAHIVGCYYFKRMLSEKEIKLMQAHLMNEHNGKDFITKDEADGLRKKVTKPRYSKKFNELF